MDLERFFFAPSRLKKQEAEIIAQYEAGDHEPPTDFGSYRMLLKEGREDFARRHAVMDMAEARLYTEQVFELCPQAQTIIDIGCGPGVITEALRARYGAEILGVDGSQDAVEYARHRFPACRFERFWVEDCLPWTYDLIHARTFYPFCRASSPEVQRFYFNMLLRHLNPGGTLLLNIHDKPKGVFKPEVLEFRVKRTLAPRIKLQRVLGIGAGRIATALLSPVVGPQTYFYTLRK